MKEINTIFYRGRAGDFKQFADRLEDKYYGWKLVDVIKDVKEKNEK